MTKKQRAAIAAHIQKHGQLRTAALVGINQLTLGRAMGLGIHQSTLKKLEKFADKLLAKEGK